VFPFWPRPRGSLAPDLVIVEYRQQSFHVTPKDKDNVFAFVEVKFPNDWVNPRQMQEYNELLGETPASSKRLALLRVPEDCVDFAPKKEGAKAAERENRGRKK
jgi:hypothetical protein